MSVDSLTEYGRSFQTNTITALLTDPRFLEQTSDILDPKYFDSDADNWIVNTIKNYFDDYSKLPTLDVFKTEVAEIDKNQKIVTKDDQNRVDLLKNVIVNRLREIYVNIEQERDDLEHTKDRFIAFVRNQEMKKAIMRSVDLLQQKKYAEIKDLIDKAQNAGISKDLGMQYKEDFAVEQRLSEIARNVMETPWDPINEILGGGLGKGELGCVVAPSGAGKSWLLVAIAAHLVKIGKKVILYTLELSEDYVSLRFDAHFTGIASNNMKFHKDDLKKTLAGLKGDLIVKNYPTKSATVSNLKAHTRAAIAFGFEPDVILVDYADLLIGETKYGQDEKRFELETIYEQLRGMAGEFEVPLWTASQTNRAALDDDWIGAERISEAYQKVMISDFIMALSRKTKDKEENTGRISIIKNRFGPDFNQFPAKVNTAFGYINVYEESSVEGKEVASKMITDAEHDKKMIRNFLDSQKKVDDMG